MRLSNKFYLFLCKINLRSFKKLIIKNKYFWYKVDDKFHLMHIIFFPKDKYSGFIYNFEKDLPKNVKNIAAIKNYDLYLKDLHKMYKSKKLIPIFGEALNKYIAELNDKSNFNYFRTITTSGETLNIYRKTGTEWYSNNKNKESRLKTAIGYRGINLKTNEEEYFGDESKNKLGRVEPLYSDDIIGLLLEYFAKNN